MTEHTLTERDRSLDHRVSPLEMTPEAFRQVGHRLVDHIGDLLASLRDRPVTPGESPGDVRKILDSRGSIPETGADAGAIVERATKLMFEHSLYNGHPRFWGYITSSAAPIGALGDLLAAAVNSNCGAWRLSPVATEIEAQTVRWIADLIGYPTESGGVLVSGGNMANYLGFLAARVAKAGWDVRTSGFRSDKARQMVIYTSAETHTWVQKAADLFGMGTEAIRWIETDDQLCMKTGPLVKQIARDRADGYLPFLLIGTAGSVSTGAIDPLPELAEISREHDLWFHVDGAYGGFAAAVPEVTDDIRGLSEADSVAVDPHKWLYSPLEAGCTLVRDPEALRAAFSYHPPYYHFGEEALNFVDFGMQNSRGNRALKVWLGLQQAGRQGYIRMIGDDIKLARVVYESVDKHPEFEAGTHSLSITTFRFVPSDLCNRVSEAKVVDYLNKLNEEILVRLERSGEAFLSNAIIDGKFYLRLCIVNFRTTLSDIEALPGFVSRIGKQTDAEMRQTKSRA